MNTSRIANNEERMIAAYIRDVRRAMMRKTDIYSADEILFNCMASVLASYRNNESQLTLADELIENG